MNINQIILHDYQTESAVVLGIIILIATVYVYVSDLRRERDDRDWEEYRRKAYLRDRGIESLCSRKKEQGS